MNKTLRFMGLIVAMLFAALGFVTCLAFVSADDGSAAADKAGTLTYHFLDVNSLPYNGSVIGSGDCIIIEDRTASDYKDDSDRVIIMVDTGVNVDSSEEKVVSYLEGLGVKKIDHMFLSHPHNDHIGGVPALVDHFDVTNVYYNSPKDWSKLRPLDKVDYKTKMHYDQCILAIDRAINSDGSKINVIHPDEEAKVYQITDNSYFTVYNCLAVNVNNYREQDFNDFSMVIKYTYKDVNALLTGDINLIYEYVFMGQVDKNGNRVSADDPNAIDPVGPIQIFKLPHHGTEGSLTSETLFNMLNPTKDPSYLSVITGWIANVGASTYPRLEKFGYQHRLTCEGDVIIETDGTNFAYAN